jgi:RecB family exonuclease
LTVQIITTRYGASALETLRDVVRAVKADDPMAPVTLLLPNNLAAVVARRSLAEGLSEAGNAVAGVHLATLSRLAEELGAAALAPRRPATNPIVGAAWRAALDREPGVFEAVRDHPATIRALVRTHRELRDITEAARDAVAECSGLTRDLVRLHRTVTASLEADFYDQTDILDAATSRLSAEPAAAAELGKVILYLPQELALAEARFARALSDITDTTVLLGLTDVKRADSAVRRSLDRMGSPFVGPQGNPRVADEVFHASDSDDEIRCVVRDVVQTLESTPAHRVAVLYGATQPYARLLHEHLSAARITVNGTGTRPVIERAIGRGFLDILKLAVDDMPRADFFRAVSEAPTKAFGGDRVPASRWEGLSRSAAVVSGDDWSHRLQTYAASIQRAVKVEQTRDDRYQSRIDAYERELQTAGELRAFATTLRERLRVGQKLTTWSDLSGWAVDLFHDLYGDPQALSKLPPEEQYAAVTVHATLRGLGDLDAFESSADLQRLIDVLTLELEAALPRVGRFGEGILVAPLSASIGLDVDVLYVVGLAEDSYPGRLGEDALLLERVRDASQGELSSYRDRLEAKHRHLLAAFDAAPRVVASFPRGDLRRSTGRLPSRWLLPTLRELSGDKALSATEWESAVSDQIIGSRSYALSLTSLTMPATEQEWRTHAVAADISIGDRVVDESLALVRARASDAFTRYDGNLTGAAGLPNFADGTGLVSPTALEAYAVCPHAYFMERLLRIKPIEQPEELMTISPLDIGTLMHETMDAFITEFTDSLPSYGQPWTAAHRSRLREIANVKAAEFEGRGLTGHRALWEDERIRILADLASMLDNDDERRALHGWRVLKSELAFGKDGFPPVVIEVDGGTVLMRGSADLVEEDRDGTLIVIDIKTGGTSNFVALKKDRVAAGTKLQLPVYAYAALQQLGGENAEAAYWFVRPGKRDWIPVELTDEIEALYANAVGTLVGSLASGLFPAKAPDGPEFGWVTCHYCNPDGLGHGEVRTRWERKRLDPALERLVRLVDPTALESTT